MLISRRAAVVAIFLMSTACRRAPDESALALHRNLGKAYYENPTSQQQAVNEFKQALALAPDSPRDKLNYALALLKTQGHEDEAVKLLEEVQKQDPALPHTWFNLGIVYKRRGDTKRAITQFEGMIARAPDEAVGHFQLGSLYRQSHRDSDAKAQFETAAKLDPQLAAARFQLYDMSRHDGNAAVTKQYLDDFQRIKEVQKTWVVPEDVEWCKYAEIYDPPKERSPAPNPQVTYANSKLDIAVDAATAGLTLIDLDNAGETDLLVWSAKGIAVFRQGQKLVTNTGLESLKNVIFVAPGDFDNDGLMDLCVLTNSGPALYRNTGGHFIVQETTLPQRRFNAAVWIDYDHDYDSDLILLGSQPALMRNQGEAGWTDHTSDFPFLAGDAVAASKLRVDPDSKAFDLAVSYRDRGPVLYRDLLGGRYKAESFQGTAPERVLQVDADFEGAGRIDRVRIANDGSVHHMRNDSAKDHWIRVRLKGIRSPKLAEDALVEIKAGTLYRSQFYEGVPLTFDTGDHSSIDVVRITWPNGLIQNETQQSANQTHVIEEAQRLSGSCPMIWTWDGHGFRFITDVLGVAPLGARNGDGTFFPVNHEEYVQIPGDSLQLSDGHYEVRVTEELSEVSYIDQVQLYALDHPEHTEVFTNEKFKAPPYPEFRLFGVDRRIYPESAHDEKGNDVLSLIERRDERYPDSFKRSETGVAEVHFLELDFGRAATSGNALLLLNGWVDWPDGSTFQKAAQETRTGLIMPYLQVQDASGKWTTIDNDMGMPAGKPKTIAVPLRFLSNSRKVRIVTNLCVYWDEIFLAADNADAPHPKQLVLANADLRFRGFSQTRIDPARKQPDRYFYSALSGTFFWNPTAGLYTKYGAVEPLLRDIDDEMVIMGSGDELRLTFAAPTKSPGPGWTRDFLLKVDGWAKDSDPNTAFSSSVAPLPFHGMSRYPYPSAEHYPRDGEHARYQTIWNTRPAAKLISHL